MYPGGVPSTVAELSAMQPSGYFDPLGGPNVYGPARPDLMPVGPYPGVALAPNGANLTMYGAAPPAPRGVSGPAASTAGDPLLAGAAAPASAITGAGGGDRAAGGPAPTGGSGGKPDSGISNWAATLATAGGIAGAPLGLPGAVLGLGANLVGTSMDRNRAIDSLQSWGSRETPSLFQGMMANTLPGAALNWAAGQFGLASPFPSISSQLADLKSQIGQQMMGPFAPTSAFGTTAKTGYTDPLTGTLSPGEWGYSGGGGAGYGAAQANAATPAQGLNSGDLPYGAPTTGTAAQYPAGFDAWNQGLAPTQDPGLSQEAQHEADVQPGGTTDTQSADAGDEGDSGDNGGGEEA
jgi:hypothetical protein